MSASKKKITQDELRRLMNEQKKKLLSNVKKIESPLAKYDKDGVLHCVICETVVRSDAVWGVHINSKNHKQNIINKIKKKEEPLQENVKSKAAAAAAAAPPPPNLKRPAPPPLPVTPPKKLKGILKNATLKPAKEEFKKPMVPEIIPNINNEAYEEPKLNLNQNELNDEENEPMNQDVLPEGFFDDPKLDAKVRNVEYKDPIEEEWLQFQKEIKEETNKAQQIISEDQEEATTERQIDEIDEQIRNWSRVLNLEKKKEQVESVLTNQKSNMDQDDNSEDEEDFEEFLDWRSKKSFDNKFKKNLIV